MRKFVVIVILLLITGGITYGLRGKVIGEKAPAATNVSANSQTEGKREASEKGRRSRDRGERRVSVEVGEVEVGKVMEKLAYVGSLMAEASVDVFSKIEGRLEQIRVDVGDRVQRGDLVAEIEDEELVQAVREAEASLRVTQAALKEKQAELKNVERELGRAKQLLEKNFISRQEYDAAETRSYAALAQAELVRAQVAQKEAVLHSARIQLGYTKIHAPRTGYVAKRSLDAGTMVKTNTPILSLVDIDPVTTLISVVETDYGRVRVGQSAAIAVDAFPGQAFQGKVVRLSPVLDSQTRTADVEIEIANPKYLLKPGMFARVELTLHKREKSLVVPEAAIVRRGATVGVFKLDDERQAAFVPVETGASYDGRVEVFGQIGRGDRVVTLGAHLLEDGSRVRVSKAPGS